MLDHEEKFEVVTISRSEVADELNGYLDDDHQLAADDPRLTQDVCMSLATFQKHCYEQFMNEEEFSEETGRHCRVLIQQIGLGEFLDEEWQCEEEAERLQREAEEESEGDEE
jgi:hypothetical protein